MKSTKIKNRRKIIKDAKDLANDLATNLINELLDRAEQDENIDAVDGVDLKLNMTADLLSYSWCKR